MEFLVYYFSIFPLPLILVLTFCLHYTQHSRTPPLLHHDLKPQNLLVAKNWKVKISDFGTAKLLRDLVPNHPSHSRSPLSSPSSLASPSSFSASPLQERDETTELRSLLTASNTSLDLNPLTMSIDVGSILYMGRFFFFSYSCFSSLVSHTLVLFKAPEIARKAGSVSYGKAVDVFSFGMTMWTIAKGNGEEPYGGMKTMVEGRRLCPGRRKTFCSWKSRRKTRRGRRMACRLG
jgi:serine/threonine protein kinase